MDLQKEFRKFIASKKLFSSRDKILLAVSGGVDSAVMAELFHRGKYQFAIAHCNFQLRGKDSDKDEAFVKELAKKYKVNFYSRRFYTEEYSEQHKLSIQESARDLRYSYFKELKSEHNFYGVATAHHFNDSVETFFINVLRGTGIAGLKGIPAMAHSPEQIIIRPLIFASRREVEAFAKTEKLKFRHDVSNDTDAYLRNRIRHHLIPLLLELNPQFEKVMKRNMESIAFAEHIYSDQIAAEARKMLHTLNGECYYDRKELEKKEHAAEYLVEFLKPYGFNASQATDIWNTTTSGKQFFSAKYSITINRGRILIDKIQNNNSTEVPLRKEIKKLQHPFFVLKIKVIANHIKLPTKSTIHCLDFDKLAFPLSVRKWKEGDSFYPLGMNHHKKVSDFLIDKKISRPMKEKTYVLASGNDIVCILGSRIDERYKVAPTTKKIYYLDYTVL